MFIYIYISMYIFYILLCHLVTVRKTLKNLVEPYRYIFSILFSHAFILSHCVLTSLTNSMCLALSLLLLGPVLQHGFLARATARDLAPSMRSMCQPVSQPANGNLSHVSCELNRIEPPCATAWAPRVDNDLHTCQLLRPMLVCKTGSLHHSSRHCWAHTCLNGMRQACCNCG